MQNNTPDYLTGSTSKPKIDKNFSDFLREWFNTLFTLKRLVYLLIALLAAKYIIDFSIIKFQLPAIFQIQIGVLLFPFVLLVAVVFIVRSIGLVAEVFFPSIKAKDFTIDDGGVTFLKLDGKEDYYAFDITERFILTYNTRGLYISTTKKGHFYTLTIDPKDIEVKLDTVSNSKFNKEVSNIQSSEGDIRTVYYSNLAFVVESKKTVLDKETKTSPPARGMFTKFFRFAVLLSLVGAIIFLCIGVYNSSNRITVYKTSFINEINVDIPEDAYSMIEGDTMLIVVEKNTEFTTYKGEIDTTDAKYDFSGYTYKKMSGGSQDLAGYISIPKVKQFKLTMSPETKYPFSLKVQYLK